MRAFSFLSAAFRDLASWIQSLAEAEADREEQQGSSSPQPFSSDAPHSPRSTSASITSPSLPQHSASLRSPDPRYDPSAAEDDAKGKKPSATPPLRTSVFLSGRTFDADGFGARSRGAMAQIRSRGLAELVGRPDFFIELHARFVALLAQLSVLFAGGGGSLSV